MLTGLGAFFEEFTSIFDHLKPLCREIRGILFKYKDGLFTGTLPDPEKLYGTILEIFDEAITKIANAEGSLGIRSLYLTNNEETQAQITYYARRTFRPDRGLISF